MDEMMFFRKNALLDGLCKEWSEMWGACHSEKEKLMRLVLMQQSAPYFATYCNQGKGLTKDYCKREYKDYINGRVFNDCDDVKGYTYSMYIDAPTSVLMHVDVAQFLWCNNTSVTIEKTKCPTLYISNHSNVELMLEGFNTPHIYLFDDSVLNINDAGDESTVVVYKYSKDAKVNVGKYCLCDVKVHEKELRI